MADWDSWGRVLHLLADYDPLRVKEIKARCSYTEVAIAWKHNRFDCRGVGWEVKKK